MERSKEENFPLAGWSHTYLHPATGKFSSLDKSVIHKKKIVFGYKVFNNVTFRVVIFTSPKDIVTIEVTN